MGAFTSAELDTEIAALKARIAAINAAFATLSDPTITRYKYDTGQSIIEVDRQKLEGLYATVPSLINQANVLYARKTGDGTLHVAAAF